MALGIAAVVVAVVLPVCNMLPAGSPLAISNFTLNLFGKFLTYAILALTGPSSSISRKHCAARLNFFRFLCKIPTGRTESGASSELDTRHRRTHLPAVSSPDFGLHEIGD